MLLCFFFKQKTAYEMRISDWSSDVCSSDLESVIAAGADILMDSTVDPAVDYEVELTVIIGKGGRGIKKADALKHVWGYTIVNDVTARDLQGRHSQWLIGKSQDTFCPMGPWEIGRAHV